MRKIPIIEAYGSNYEIGSTIGQKLKKQLRTIIKIEEKDYKEESGKTLAYHASRVKLLITLTKKYFPQYLDEIKGIAEGSGIDLNIIFALGSEDDLIYNCTSVAGVSKEGIILGHNEDWRADHINSLFLCKIHQRKKPDSLSLGYIGHLPGFSIGINSEGFGYTGNSLHFKNVNKKGIPLHFFIRAGLDVTKYSDIIKLASMKNRMIGVNSLIVFKNKIFNVEFTPTNHAIINGDKYLAHTNHVLSKKIINQEARRSKSSELRLLQANKMLKNNEFSFNLVKKILCDHTNKPISICCHEYEEKGYDPDATLASVIVKVDKKEFYVAHGNPCKSKYKKYVM